MTQLTRRCQECLELGSVPPALDRLLGLPGAEGEETPGFCRVLEEIARTRAGHAPAGLFGEVFPEGNKI